MKSEALTYPVRALEELGESASAPQILGRSDTASGGICDVHSVPFSRLALACWFWMSVQIMGRLSRTVLPVIPRSQQAVEIWIGAETDPDSDNDEPVIVVRMNRSILRRLRRLERLKKIKRGGTALRGSVREETLSPAQLMQRRCRRGHIKGGRIKEGRVGRTRVFGLNFALRELVLRAVSSLNLQGSALCVGAAATCSALLSPD